MTEFYTAEIAALVREHGYARTAEILAERRKAAREPQEPEQGEASELSESDWRAAIEANKRKASGA